MPKLIGFPEPVPEIFALGCLVSFTGQSFSLKQGQIDEVLSLVSSLLLGRTCPVKQLARVAGLLVSSTHCLGPATRMRTRAMYQSIEERLKPQERLNAHTARHLGWSRSMPIRANTKAELRFWITNIQRVNGQPFQRSLIHRVLQIALDTDASKHG